MKQIIALFKKVRISNKKDAQLARAVLDNDKGKQFIEMLMKHVSYGQYSEHPEVQRRIFEQSAVVNHILKLVHGELIKGENEDG